MDRETLVASFSARRREQMTVFTEGRTGTGTYQEEDVPCHTINAGDILDSFGVTETLPLHNIGT